jgi:uncharacterized protein YjbJ (UPF0337 family)
MNAEQFKESWDQLKGALKKDWVKISDDDLLRIGGDQKRFHTVIEMRYGSMKGEVSRYADRWYARWSGWYEGYTELVTTSEALP